MPLIGFAGAPFTLFCYLVEGRGIEGASSPRRAFSTPSRRRRPCCSTSWPTLTLDYLAVQVGAGAQALMLFDSWAGLLGPDDLRALRACPRCGESSHGLASLGVPRHLFPEPGRDAARSRCASLPVEVVGVDWRLPLSRARAHPGRRASRVQGNLDPAALFAPDGRAAPPDRPRARRGRAGNPGTSSTSGTASSRRPTPTRSRCLVDHVHAAHRARRSQHDDHAFRASIADLVRRFDRPGPRYTSYPTAVEFHEGVGEAAYREHLARADAREPDEPLSLYVHLPFCIQHCSYCGCHVIATPRHDVAAQLPRLPAAASSSWSAAQLPRRRRLVQMHWGGGTPTYLEPDELEQLFAHVTRALRARCRTPRCAIEVDPRVTSREHLETLARLGFNRLSMGVQDFTPEVQEAIGRGQTFEQTRDLVAERAPGRLPRGHQPRPDLRPAAARPRRASTTNLDRLIELRPDRLAVYSFAYVPWIRPNQKRIDATRLPAREDEARALPRRPRRGWSTPATSRSAWTTSRCPATSSRAPRAHGRLDRNFMGYTVQAGERHDRLRRLRHRRGRGGLLPEREEALDLLRRRSTPDGCRSSAATGSTRTTACASA